MLKAFDAKTAAHALQLARETLQNEAAAITALEQRLDADDTVAKAIELLLNCKGRVVVSGIGKSGHIARKMAATFAS
ncbi:MAG: KpsF/GutQ family sugar-phosphate isomerase, partial [Duganella sp.]